MRALLCLMPVLLLMTAPPAGADAPDSMANVELAIRGPDARRLTDAAVTLKPPPHDTVFDKVPPSLSLRTDAQGIVRFAYPAGVYRLAVAAPGIGYGTVGLTEFIPGQRNIAELPPLAPYAHVTGTLPVSVRRDGVRVFAQGMLGDPAVSAAPDAQGRFDLGLESGKWFIWAGTGPESAGIVASLGYVTTVPGQKPRDAVLQPVAPPQPAAQTVSPTPQPPTASEHPTAVWAHGTVRDEAGHPMPDATVLALATFDGGIRMYETTAKAVTDAEGRYSLEGKGDLAFFNATILAVAPGRAPAWAWPSFPQAETPWPGPPAGTPPPEPPVVDLVLPSRAGRLDVTVLEDGKPVAGIPVAAYLENANLRDIWARGGGDPEQRKLIDDTAYPIVTTGADGIAHFDRLLPGRYGVLAARDDLRSIAQGYFLGNVTTPYGSAKGLPIRLGETTEAHLAIYAQPKQVTLRLLRHDGSVQTGDTSFQFGLVGSTGTSAGSVPFDQTGTAEYAFQGPGLWHVEASYRISPIKYVPYGEPRFSAIGTLALSPRLAPGYKPTLTARRIDPPAIRIELQDPAGRPLRGIVQIVRGQDYTVAAGSTDLEGRIRFAGLPEGDGDGIRPIAAGYPPMDFGDETAPLPTVDQLRNRTELLAQSLPIERGTERRVVLRPELVGYVAGTLRPPEGEDRGSAQISLYLDPANPESGASLRYDAATGRFVAGPFRAGTIRLKLVNGTPRGGGIETVALVEIQPGQVAEPSLTAPPKPAAPAAEPDQMMLGMGGLTARTGNAGQLNATVVLADGRTPALGAQLLYFEPGNAQPTILAMTDALGEAHPRGLWQSANILPGSIAQGPADPVVVAFLPGSTGATIVPAPARSGDKLRITLPPAQGVGGQVTVAGVAPTHRPGQIRVVAAYQDRGMLNPALSLETTADPEGRFQLAGLTPGRYLVQAALDEIWLSPAVEQQVGERDPAPIALAIPAPGAPVRIRLLDRAGRPAIGARLTLDRPAGPLAATLWPALFEADGAGVIQIPTVEAGRQTVRAEGSDNPVGFDVPALPAKAPVEVSITVDRPPA